MTTLSACVACGGKRFKSVGDDLCTHGLCRCCCPSDSCPAVAHASFVKTLGPREVEARIERLKAKEIVVSLAAADGTTGQGSKGNGGKKVPDAGDDKVSAPAVLVGGNSGSSGQNSSAAAEAGVEMGAMMKAVTKLGEGVSALTAEIRSGLVRSRDDAAFGHPPAKRGRLCGALAAPGESSASAIAAMSDAEARAAVALGAAGVDSVVTAKSETVDRIVGQPGKWVEYVLGPEDAFNEAEAQIRMDLLVGRMRGFYEINEMTKGSVARVSAEHALVAVTQALQRLVNNPESALADDGEFFGALAKPLMTNRYHASYGMDTAMAWAGRATAKEVMDEGAQAIFDALPAALKIPKAQREVKKGQFKQYRPRGGGSGGNGGSGGGQHARGGGRGHGAFRTNPNIVCWTCGKKGHPSSKCWSGGGGGEAQGGHGDGGAGNGGGAGGGGGVGSGSGGGRGGGRGCIKG